MTAALILLRDDKPVSQFAVELDQPATVGRGSGCLIQIHDPKISRSHCEIRATPEGCFIRDLGSKNGTFVNGARVIEARLRNGDRIQAGLAQLLFRCDTVEEDAVAAQTAPPHLCAACGHTIPLDALATARRTQSRVYCAACTAACPLLGRIIGRYEIVQPLGHGSIGAVYKADQLSMGRLVALKVLHDALTADRETVGRFLRDARAVGQLSHPNIVRIYDMNQAEGRYFISMEYAQGGDLGSLLARQGPMPLRQVLDHALAACAALVYAHNAGAVHRSLKPSNLLLTRDGILKVADLGLAKSLDIAGLSSLSSTSSSLAHVIFMPPEQITNASAADARADTYSLAMTCYHLLSGQFPYQAASITELARAFLNQKPRPLRALREDCPAELDAVLLRGIAPEPARRVQSAEEFRAALQAIRSKL